MSVPLLSKISNLCGPDPPTSQTDGQTTCDGNTALCTIMHRAVKSYYGGPMGTHQRSFKRYHPPLPTASSSPRLGGSQPPPKNSIAVISGTGKATDFKFGRYIHRVHPNKSLLKFWRKWSVGVSRDNPNFFQYPLLSQERVELRTSNYVRTFISRRGRSQGLSIIFRAPK